MNPIDEWHLPTAFIGKRVLVFDELDSTNTYCLRYANSRSDDGLAVLAFSQTAGRGQHGRSWTCESHSGILLSVLLFPPPELQRPSILTSWAGVSVCDLIVSLTGLVPTLKWPNDVYVNDHKVCGILIEQKQGIVVGIGLNLNQEQQSYVAQDLPQAASLKMFTGQDYDIKTLTQQLLQILDGHFQSLADGNRQALIGKWQSYYPLIGQFVLATTHKGDIAAFLVNLTLESIVLRTANEETLTFAPEAIVRIRKW